MAVPNYYELAHQRRQRIREVITRYKPGEQIIAYDVARQLDIKLTSISPLMNGMRFELGIRKVPKELGIWIKIDTTKPEEVISESVRSYTPTMLDESQILKLRRGISDYELGKIILAYKLEKTTDIPAADIVRYFSGHEERQDELGVRLTHLAGSRLVYLTRIR